MEAHTSSSLDRWRLGENACKMGCSSYPDYLLKIPLSVFIVTQISAFCPVNLSGEEREKANHIQTIVFLLSRIQWLQNKLDMYVLKFAVEELGNKRLKERRCRLQEEEQKNNGV